MTAGGSAAGKGGPPAGAPSGAARADLGEGLGWAGLGLAILVLSLSMDRLAEQGVEPYAVPGLLPGLLGIGMMLFGGLLVWRGRGMVRLAAGGARTKQKSDLRAGRLLVVLALCLTYSVALVGHGIPFWLASWVFVSASILVLQHGAHQEAGRAPNWTREIALATFIGLCAGVFFTVLFQYFFLVHLP